MRYTLKTLTTVITLATLVAIGCARGKPNPQPAQESVTSAAHDLAGNWVLRAEPHLPAPGVSLTVTVDSSLGDRVFGRLSHLFTGNVGTDTRDYRPFVGSIDAAGEIDFTIEKQDPSLLGLAVSGQVRGDTIRCHRLVLGPDEVSSGDRVWLFVRERR